METRSVTLENGKITEYIIINDVAYNTQTPVQVVEILERSRLSHRKIRLRIHYGDPATGDPWGDIETGYIGRSTGTTKIPIIIRKTTSFGGPGILDYCICRIDEKTETNKNYKIVYQKKEGN
jgi:hypothetical protein